MAHGFLSLERLLCGACGAIMAMKYSGPATFEGAIPVKDQKFSYLTHCMNPQCEEFEEWYVVYLPRIELHEIPSAQEED